MSTVSTRPLDVLSLRQGLTEMALVERQKLDATRLRVRQHLAAHADRTIREFCDGACTRAIDASTGRDSADRLLRRLTREVREGSRLWARWTLVEGRMRLETELERLMPFAVTIETLAALLPEAVPALPSDLVGIWNENTRVMDASLDLATTPEGAFRNAFEQGLLASAVPLPSLRRAWEAGLPVGAPIGSPARALAILLEANALVLAREANGTHEILSAWIDAEWDRLEALLEDRIVVPAAEGATPGTEAAS